MWLPAGRFALSLSGPGTRSAVGAAAHRASPLQLPPAPRDRSLVRRAQGCGPQVRRFRHQSERLGGWAGDRERARDRE